MRRRTTGILEVGTRKKMLDICKREGGILGHIFTHVEKKLRAEDIMDRKRRKEAVEWMLKVNRLRKERRNRKKMSVSVRD